MNIRSIWSSKLRSNIDYDFFNEAEFDKLDGAIGLELLSDQESLAQWRQKMYEMSDISSSHANAN